jgi:hypothetical protein
MILEKRQKLLGETQAAMMDCKEGSFLVSTMENLF